MKTHLRFVVLSSFMCASALSASAGAQSAPPCPEPADWQCRNKEYIATECGKLQQTSETGKCADVARADYRAEMSRTDLSIEQATLPKDPNSSVAVATRQHTFFRNVARDLTGEYMGFDQRRQLFSATNGITAMVVDGITRTGLDDVRTKKQDWASSGSAVRSCSEYVYEKYFDYSKYRDLADVSLTRDEATFDAAYDATSGIANKTLKSKSGATNLPSVAFPSNGRIGTIIVGGVPRPLNDARAPKNGFFKGYRSLSAGGFFGAETALRNKLQAGISHHVVNWAWHQQMRQALSSYAPETLRFYESAQQDFLGAVLEREHLVKMIATFGPSLTTDNPPVTRDLSAELVAHDAVLWAQLRVADAEGCLDPVNASKCDWSHRSLRDQVGAFYSKDMEAAYQRCVQNTGGNFNVPNAPIRNAVATFGASANNKSDYTARAEDVDAFYGVVQDWVTKGDFPRDAVTKKPKLGNRASNKGRLGDGSIYVDWEYDAGWDVTGFDKTSEICNANVSVDGRFSATGHAYGTTLNLIDAKAHVFTERPSGAQAQGKAKVYLTVVDHVLWNRWDNPYTQDTLTTGLAKEFSGGDEKTFDTTVYPFGIPVTLSAGFGMSVGLKFDAKASAAASCSTPQNLNLATVTATLTPWAQADAFVGAGVGFHGFQAGLKCDLVLVRGEMPITGDAALVFKNGQLEGNFGMSGRQKFRMLDGTLKAFVDAPGDFLDSEWTVFSWQGPSIDEELFNFNKNAFRLSLAKPYVDAATTPAIL